MLRATLHRKDVNVVAINDPFIEGEYMVRLLLMEIISCIVGSSTAAWSAALGGEGCMRHICAWLCVGCLPAACVVHAV